MGSNIFFSYLEEKYILKDKQRILDNMKSFLNLSGEKRLHDCLSELRLLPLVNHLPPIRDLDTGDIIKKIWGYDTACER